MRNAWGMSSNSGTACEVGGLCPGHPQENNAIGERPAALGVAAAAQGGRPAGQSRHRARLLIPHLLRRRYHGEAGLWPSEAALAASIVQPPGTKLSLVHTSPPRPLFCTACAHDAGTHAAMRQGVPPTTQACMRPCGRGSRQRRRHSAAGEAARHCLAQGDVPHEGREASTSSPSTMQCAALAFARCLCCR